MAKAKFEAGQIVVHKLTQHKFMVLSASGDEGYACRSETYETKTFHTFELAPAPKEEPARRIRETGK